MAATHPRTGLIALLATAVASAFVGGAAVLLLGNADDSPDTAAPTTTVVEDATPASPIPTTEPDTPGDIALPDRDEQPDDDATIRDDYPYPDEPEYVDLPPMGIEDAVFDWTVTELTSSISGESWIHQLVEIDGTLWAVGGGYDEATDRAHSFVFSSPDGVTWQRKELPAEIEEAGHAQLTATEAGIVAVVNAWDSMADEPELSVFVSVDGATWTRSDPSSIASPTEQMWLNQVAGTRDVLIMLGARAPVIDEPHDQPVISIDQDGYTIELDEATWSYVVIDANGEVVAYGSQEHLWSEDGIGLSIYDSASGDIVFSTNWEDVDRAATAAYESVAWGESLLITLVEGDRTLTMDEFTGVVFVTDETGTVLFEGTERDLWQGPPPTFRDRDGNVIVVVPWDVWERAHEAIYQGDEGYSPTPVMLRSTDGGATWQSVDIDNLVSDAFYFQTLVGGPAGFVAIGTNEPPYEDYPPPEAEPPVVLVSPDGLSWSQVATSLEANDWLNSVVATADGYLATLGGSHQRSEVVGTPDGATWQPVLTQTDLLLELGNVWFERVASGGVGTLVTGMYDGYSAPDLQPMTFGRDGRTLTQLGPEFTVTDDATGAVLFSFSESESGYYEEGVGAPRTGFKWGQGGLAMFADDGGVIFAFSHREWDEAMSGPRDEPEVYYRVEPALFFSDGFFSDGFFSDGDGWRRVHLPDDLGPHVWISGMVVTDSSVVLTYTSESHSEYDYTIRCLALVGTPAP